MKKTELYLCGHVAEVGVLRHCVENSCTHRILHKENPKCSDPTCHEPTSKNSQCHKMSEGNIAAFRLIHGKKMTKRIKG
jgi:hypothetical protein